MATRSKATLALGALFVFALLALSSLAVPALAATVTNQRPLLFSFDGADTTAGKFQATGSGSEAFFGGVGPIALDDSTGSIYVVDGTAEAVDKFDPEGKAEDFSAGPAAGTSSLLGPSSAEPFAGQNPFFFGSPTSLAVDNSGGNGASGEGEQGRLYVATQGGPIDTFDREGGFLWSISPEVPEERLCGMTVDAQGHLWASFGENAEPARGELLEFDTTGTGTPSLAPVREVEITSGNRLPCALAIDKSGESIYVADQQSSFTNSAGSPGLDKYVGGTFDSRLSSTPTRTLGVDQTAATGHLFAVAQFEREGNSSEQVDSSFDEYEPCSSPGCGAALLSSSGPGRIGDARGIAYNPTQDWVYVTDHLTQTVKVFGPLASGPAPSVAVAESDEITRTEATLHGNVNPGGLPNTYHFEWVRAEAQKIVIDATSGRFWLSPIRGLNHHPAFEHIEGVTNPLPFDISPAALQTELEVIFGPGNLVVTGAAAAGGAPGEFEVLFKNELAGRFVPKLHGLFLFEAEEQEAGGPYKGGFSVDHPGGFDATVTSKGQLWAQATNLRTRPEAFPGIEPPDSANHAVSLHLTGLQPNTPYNVRLVGTNTEPEGDPEKRLDAYSGVETFSTLPPPHPDLTGLTISAVTTDSAHVAATVDPHEDETVWRIFVSSEAQFGASQAECEELPQTAYALAEEGDIPLGETSPVGVEAELSDLPTGTTVCVRLVAINGGGVGSAEAVFTTTAVKPSEASLAFVAPRTQTTARLNAYVNPEGGAPLTYRFEYSADGSTWIPLPERVSTTASHIPIVVADELTGLSPGTTYFYRLALVKNQAGEISAASLGGEKTFTTRTAAEMSIPADAFGQPDRRGIELVNTPDKGDQNVSAVEFYSGASPLRADGEEALWTTLGGAPGGNSGTQPAFLASRTASGWVSRSLLPPAAEQVGGGSLSYYPVAADPDFSRFLFAPAVPSVLTTGPPTFVRLDLGGNQQILHSYQQEIQSREDVSTDTAHVLVVDPDTRKLEDIGSGTPEDIGLVPPAGAPVGVPQPGGSAPACGLDPTGASFIGGGANAAATTELQQGYHRMASTDASRVYFQTSTDSSSPSCNGPWTLYERNRQGEPETTTPIVSPALATADTAMIRATADGRTLYFVTSAKLAAVDGNGQIDLYRWEEEGHKATCLTCGVKNELGKTINDADLERLGQQVHQSVVLVSDDFSHFYFNSPKRLVAGHGIEGGQNLYVLSGGIVRFVAPSVLLDSSQSLSSDGNVLTFRSSARLTADRIASACPDVLNVHGGVSSCAELYRYDDRDGSLECISCRRGSATANSVTLSAFGRSFQVSADGSTAAFVTAEALITRDVNRGADLYEWRNGAVRLLTDGVTDYPTGPAGPTPEAINPDGSDLLFTLAAPGLTGFEHDGLANLYNARLGGGFAVPNPAAHCSEESCQGPLQAAPSTALAGSAGFHGSGNQPPSRKCRKGKVRRHGHCVRKQHHKQTRHRKHHRHRRAHR